MKVEGSHFSADFLRMARDAALDNQIDNVELKELFEKAEESQDEDGTSLSLQELMFIVNLTPEAENADFIRQLKQLGSDFNPANVSFELLTLEEIEAQNSPSTDNTPTPTRQPNTRPERPSQPEPPTDSHPTNPHSANSPTSEPNGPPSTSPSNPPSTEGLDAPVEVNFPPSSSSLTPQEEAIASLEEALITSHGEQRQSILADLSQAHLENDDAARALEYANQAIENGADSARIYGIRAEANLNLGNDSEAVSDARRSFKIDGQSPQANYVLGHHYQKRGRLEEADSFFERAIRNGHEQTGQVSQTGQASVLREQGDFEQSETLLQSILSENPNHIDANHNMAILAYERGNIEQFFEFNERVLAQEPEHFKANQNMGNVLIEQGRSEEAIAYLERAKANMTNEDHLNIVLENLAIAYQETGQVERALEYANQAIENGANTASIYGVRAEANLDSGNDSEAVSDARHSFQLNNQNPQANYILGRHYQSRDKLEEAESFFNRAILNGHERIDQRARQALSP